MTYTALSVSGTGLITGQPVSVEIQQALPGSGIVFQLGDVQIPAKPGFVVNTDRGVTLGNQGKTLSIVEHFLSACAMTGYDDLCVSVSGAPELPLLDGSALPWVQHLHDQFGTSGQAPSDSLRLLQPVVYQAPENPEIQLLALPAETLKITYLVDFPHPDLRQRWFSWQEDQGSLIEQIAPARTFGFLSELPALQARGLALGVSIENTLGLTDEGDYTSPLRLPDEPIRHKILDLIGDLMLCGVPISRLKAHLMVACSGHGSHLAFGQQLATYLQP